MKNILVVDDSALMRRVLSDIINKDDELHTEYSATDGMEALEILKKKEFDAIVLDIIMPKMNGIELLQEMNRLELKPKVIIVSTIARHGAWETIKALELGAFDFVTKPDSLADIRSKEFAVKLLQRLYLALELSWNSSKAELLKRKLMHRMNEQPVVPGKEHSPKNGVTGSGKLVAIACSTGGPKALQKVIPRLPADLDAAVLIVQHMPVGFTASLSSRLNELSNMQVKEAEDGETLKKGTVYIARGGSQMRLIEKKRREYNLSVRVEAARNGLRPCADIMYESLKGTSFDDITCVVLTGMGADGTKGILQLEESNKIYVIAQDAESCTVYGMPKAIAESGAVDEIHDLDQIADAIIKHVGVR